MRISTLAAALVAFATLTPVAGAQSRLTSTKPAGPSLSFEASRANALTDGSFESGIGSTIWTQGSTTYGTVICNLEECGTGGGTAAPRTGDFYVWFGGAANGDVGFVQQTATIPTAASATLKFYLKIPVIAAGGTGFVAAKIDGTEVFRATYAADQATYNEYALVSVPVNAYANGASHVIRIESTTTGSGNFYVDDVSIDVPVVGPSLTANPATLAFGTTTPVGTTSPTRTVTLTNEGTAPTTITSITGSGAPFTVSTTGTTLTLAPGASTTFTVTFAPTTTTAATGTVRIVSNAPGSPLVINLTGTGFAPPANDNSANAIALTGATGTLTGTNVDATLEAGEPVASCQASTANSVWWKYTPTQAGTLTVDLSATTFDTVLTLHQPGTTEIGCDDDGADPPNGLASVLRNIPVVAGSPVLIRVAGYSGFGTPAAGAISGTFSFVGTTAGEGSADAARTFLTAAPNPLRGAASVRFATATAQDVTVSVYDVTGRQVATLFQGAVAADQQMSVGFATANLAPGVYVVRATGTDLNLTQRVTVVR